MKYLKYFESIEIMQQPFYLSNDHLYLSDDVSKRVTPTLSELKMIYKANPIWADRTIKDQEDFYNDIRTENGNLKIRNINLHKSVSYNDGYLMNLSLHRRSPLLNNEFGIFKNWLDGNSGDSNMNGPNMKRATKECNLKFIKKLYPIVEHIKNFYNIFKSKDKVFLDIIKDAIDKDITLAQYGIPNEIKHLFDENTENAVMNSMKYNL